MSDIDDIRRRWEGLEWTYGEDQEGRYIASAYMLSEDRRLLDLEEPTADERELLARCAAAPGDVRALLGDIDAAREALDNQAPTLQAAVQSVSRNQQQLIAAYHENETKLYRRAEQAEADAAALLAASRSAATVLFSLAQSPALDEQTRATIRQTLLVLDDAIGRRAGAKFEEEPKS